MPIKVRVKSVNVENRQMLLDFGEESIKDKEEPIGTKKLKKKVNFIY